MVKSGIVRDYGMGFWGPNAHDGLWHISLINQLSKFDFTHPTFPPHPLINYHYGFDLLASIIVNLTRIPPITLYFQILPPVFSLLTGILIIKLLNLLKGTKTAVMWALFFVYFGGSFGYIVNLIKGQGWGGESAFWSNQSISFLINPPLALSIIMILTGLISLFRFLERPSRLNFTVSAMAFGLLIMVKVYAGTIMLSSLTVVGLFLLWRNHDWKILKLLALSALISMFVFIPSNRKSTRLIKLDPLWFPHTMMESKDRVGWERYANARSAYMESKYLTKLLPAELIAVAIFIIGNLGTRSIGLISIFKSFRIYRSANNPRHTLILLLIVASVVSLIPTLLFIQVGTPWNMIQFFYYFQFLVGLFAALELSNLNIQKAGKLLISVFVILLTLPSTFGSLPSYLPDRPPSAIPTWELEALSFLKSQPDGIILTYPYDKSKFAEHVEPRPLFAYESTAYVSALSQHQTFLEDEVNLSISNYQLQERRQEIERVFRTTENPQVKEFLARNNIRYLYLVNNQNFSFSPPLVGLTEIYSKPGKVSIYRNVNI